MKFFAKDSLMAIRTTFIMTKSHPFFQKASPQRSLFGDSIPWVIAQKTEYVQVVLDYTKVLSIFLHLDTLTPQWPPLVWSHKLLFFLQCSRLKYLISWITYAWPTNWLNNKVSSFPQILFINTFPFLSISGFSMGKCQNAYLTDNGRSNTAKLQGHFLIELANGRTNSEQFRVLSPLT